MDEVSQDQPQREPPARLSGKVIGFRGWSLDGYRLLSANRQQHGGEWNVGPNKAECRIQERIKFLGGHDPRRASVERHDAPHPGCECGLYAYFSVRRDRNPHGFRVDDLIWGAVTAWGLIEVHAGGFRAEFAEPVALGYHPRQPYEDGQVSLSCINPPVDWFVHGRQARVYGFMHVAPTSALGLTRSRKAQGDR